MHPWYVSLKQVKVWPLPVLPIGRGGLQPKLQFPLLLLLLLCLLRVKVLCVLTDCCVQQV